MNNNSTPPRRAPREVYVARATTELAMADSSVTASSSQSGYVSVLVQGSSTLSDKDEFEDTHETGSENQECSATLLVLDVLRTPKPSALNRKRKVLTNRGRGGKRRHASTLSSSTCSEPKKVSPFQWVKEFPGEQLVVCRSKLFCNACREELHVKSSTVKNHIRSTIVRPH